MPSPADQAPAVSASAPGATSASRSTGGRPAARRSPGRGAAGPLREVGTLVARLVLGGIFLAHGWQKIFQWTFGGVSDAFAGMGIPLPGITGPVVAVVELVGGALLILGVATPIVGLVLAVDMLVAALQVHLAQGVFIDQGGWELVGALGAGALLLAAVGPGRLSLDALLRSGRRRARRRA
ncbi:DoxX family protein [Brachybacterium sp. DNPG3]